MGILATAADERVSDVRFDDDRLIVDLMDGRTIAVPLAWYPRLLHATVGERNSWEIAGAGYGIHWPKIDEDLSTEGLLRGSPAQAESGLTIAGTWRMRPSRQSNNYKYLCVKNDMTNSAIAQKTDPKRRRKTS